MRRRVAVTSFLVAMAVLGACTGDDDSRGIEVDTVTTAAAPSTPATTEAPTTPAPTTAAPTTPMPTTAAPTTPAPTAAPTTPAPALYRPTDPPVVPEVSGAPPPAPTLPDGTYYGSVVMGDDPRVVVEIVQLYRGAACETWAAASGGECNNDYGVDSSVQAYRAIEDAWAPFVSVAVDPSTSFRIDLPELKRLALGDAPAAGAPAGYVYTPFPVIITASGGRVTRIEQWWVP